MLRLLLVDFLWMEVFVYSLNSYQQHYFVILLSTNTNKAFFHTVNTSLKVFGDVT